MAQIITFAAVTDNAMAQLPKFDSIIFDLDGTLWDSTAHVAEAWQTAKQQVDYVKEDISQATVRSITGMAYDAIFDKLYPYLDEQKRNDFKALCARNELETLARKGGTLYPDLEETLAYLKGKYRLFIVSNCQSGYIENFFKLHNTIEYFEGHQCYGTKGQPKFENIKDIVADFNLKAPVYIGDTTGDRDSAQKAGVPFIFCSYGFGQMEDGFIAKIDEFAQLKQLL